MTEQSREDWATAESVPPGPHTDPHEDEQDPDLASLEQLEAQLADLDARLSALVEPQPARPRDGERDQRET